MGKIFYIMGKSSSGKDTVFKHLMEDRKLNLKNLILYTTRPIRNGETHGVEYFFTDEDGLKVFEQEKKLIEVRAYETVHGIWKYFTVDDSQVNLKTNNYLVIGTLVSFNKMKKYYGEEMVIPIYLEVDDGVRLQRALDREKQQHKPKYAEMCRRFLADEEDFSEQNISQAGIEKRFHNHALEQTTKEISEYIFNYVF